MEYLKAKARDLLRSSEHFFGVDMVYIAKGGFWTTLSFGVSILASLVTVTAFGNLLSKETYGTYSYLLSLGATLSFLTLSGTGIAVTRAVARGHEEVVPKALRLQLKWNMLAMSCVGVMALYYGFKGNMLFAIALALLAIANPVAEAFHICVAVLTGRKRFDLQTKIGVVFSLVSAVGTVFLLTFISKSVLALIIWYASFTLLSNILLYRWVTRATPNVPVADTEIEEMRRTSFHLTGAGFIGIIASYLDKIILFQVAGPAALAVYGFALAGPDRLKSLVKGWNTIALPNLAQRSLHEVHQVVYRRLAWSLLLGILLAIGYIIFSPILFKLLLPHYLESIRYSQMLALGLIVTPAIIYMGGLFAGQNMLRATYAMSVGGQTLEIILFAIFGWLWHTWGIIFATLLATFLTAIYTIVIWEWETRRIFRQSHG